MKYGTDEGAGAWITTEKDEITVSEYMIRSYQDWAKRVQNGDGGLPDAALFAAEMLKILKAFGWALPHYVSELKRRDIEDDMDL